MLHQPVCALCPIPWINGRNLSSPVFTQSSAVEARMS